MSTSTTHKNLIEIRDLSVTFPSEAGTVQAVRNVSLGNEIGRAHV